jgi:hypothetical protein
MHHTEIDDYVLDVLLPDLVGHDRSPAAVLVYLVLWKELFRSSQRSLKVSLQQFAASTGLSKSAVQAAIRILRRRSLIRVSRQTPTAVPEYELIRHWIRRRSVRHA